MNALLLVLVGCATTGPQQPLLTADDLRITDYPYNADVHGNDLPVEIVRFEVPALHDQPDNEDTIELGFLRFPAADGAIGPPIVFLTNKNPNDAVSEALILRLRQLGDVVIFNRRGYGFSSPPPPCQKRLNYPFDTPLTQDQMTPIACKQATACIAALQDAAQVPEVFAARQVTADLGLLVQALETNQMHLVAAGESAISALEFRIQSPKRVGMLAVIDLPDPNFSEERAVGSGDLLDTLAAQLQNRPVHVIHEGRSGRQLSIAIGTLDIAFLRRENPDDLTTAAAAAINGDYDALSELVLRMRQHLGQFSSIEILLAMPSGSCPVSVPTRSTDSAYAANWPKSALAPVTINAARKSNDSADHRLRNRSDVLRLKTRSEPDIEGAILTFLTKQGLTGL